MTARYHCCLKSRNYKIRLECFEGKNLRENEKRKQQVEGHREQRENWLATLSKDIRMEESRPTGNWYYKMIYLKIYLHHLRTHNLFVTVNKTR